MKSLVAIVLVALLMFCHPCQSEEVSQEIVADDHELDLTGIEDMPASAGFDFINGVAHGISPKTYNDMKKCIHDISGDSWNRLVDAKNRLHKTNPKQTAHAILDMAKIFLSVVKDCRAAAKDVANIIQKLSRDTSGAVFVEHAMKFLIHPIKLIKVVDHIVGGFAHKNYYKAGDGCGEFIGVVLGVRKGEIEELLKSLSPKISISMIQ